MTLRFTTFSYDALIACHIISLSFKPRHSKISDSKHYALRYWRGVSTILMLQFELCQLIKNIYVFTSVQLVQGKVWLGPKYVTCFASFYDPTFFFWATSFKPFFFVKRHYHCNRRYDTATGYRTTVVFYLDIVPHSSNHYTAVLQVMRWWSRIIKIVLTKSYVKLYPYSMTVHKR